MRVIAGECKGRPLKSVPGKTTRPTTDKVKETLFNMIGPFFEGGRGLDLYGGSGGLGIEALSRGLKTMIFVDKFPPAIQTIKKNLSLCQLSERAEVYRNDAERALNLLGKRQERFDLIFLDPPYAAGRLEKDVEKILSFGLLNAMGYLVIEHPKTIDFPEHLSSEIKLWKYHTAHEQTALSIYLRK
ncbi:16S rRNA (guanine(966)-N(2))-methyltransferase RsmD [Pullulanibacillus pueri]|uniref:Methyltransferase n=1 Tax=Pullulanibacillus pueri TaxID=1437324 RepID=A0A8J2ZS84_9BACL|nr:16S rRNA (guanine(966)-N(2))-methyltransferase RsmD [Pullulanibacillus pueri]MBM7680112.1 16S rRNA (guanine(966)-N(2))-methyltransferase RsmD [Pullulanibacillus pueri]GGH74417.1 methyltransferase [Pullulanibacillus pueri]